MEIQLIDISHQFDYGDVPTLLYDIYVPEMKRFVGRCEFREEVGRELTFYGNIGYIIYPPYRGHNFAYNAALQLLDIVREQKKGLHEVIITCNPDNMPSRRIIEKLNGRFLGLVNVDEDHELYEMGEVQKLVYTIKLYE